MRTLSFPSTTPADPIEEAVTEMAPLAAASRPRYTDQDILTLDEMAAFFGQGVRTIKRMRFPSVQVGRIRFYLWRTVVAYLAERVD